MVPLPYYTGFEPAVKERSRGVIIPVPFQHLDGYSGLDDIFEPHFNRMALESALIKATQDGVKARAVLLTKYETNLDVSPKSFAWYANQVCMSALTIRSVDAT